MKCWHCKTDLCWGGDHSCPDSDFFTMVTNLTCPECSSLVLVYSGIEDKLPPATIELTLSDEE